MISSRCVGPPRRQGSCSHSAHSFGPREGRGELATLEFFPLRRGALRRHRLCSHSTHCWAPKIVGFR